MNRVERPDRFHRERFPGALDDVDADSQQVPVRGGSRQVGPAWPMQCSRSTWPSQMTVGISLLVILPLEIIQRVFWL